MTNDVLENGTVAQKQIICATLLFMPIAYMVVPIAMHFTGVLPERGYGNFDEQLTLIVGGFFLMAGVSSAAFSMILKKKLVGRSERSKISEEQARFQAVLVAMVLSESGAVMGLVLMLLTGNVIFGALLCGISFAITCFHFPSRHWLENGA